MPDKLSKWIGENLLNFSYKRKSLDRYKKVLSSLNLKYPEEIILIGGTNGKGSLSELVTELARQSNLSIGTFTSPHLLNFNERIKIDGEEISDEIFLKFLKKIKNLKDSYDLNFYQIISLAALYYFNKLNLNLWVLEIGMGGRLDPMNSLEPDISVITKVALDHQEFLGDTIEDIAAEKAEIARSEKPLIVGSKKVPNAILDKASKINSILISQRNNKKSNFLKNLLKHFSQSKAISEEVLFCLYQISKRSKFKFSDELILKVSKNTKLHGRLSLIGNTLIDSAHNEDSIKNLIDYIHLNFKNKKLNLFFSCSEQKDPHKLLKPFEGLIDKIFLGGNIHDRLMPLDQVLLKTSDLNFSFIKMDSIEEIYNSVKISKPNEINLIIGSFYFSGEFFKFLLNDKGLPLSISSLNKLY